MIFLRSANSQQNELQGLKRGAMDYITEPIQPAILCARVKNQLSPKRARDVLHGHNDVGRAVGRVAKFSSRYAA